MDALIPIATLAGFAVAVTGLTWFLSIRSRRDADRWLVDRRVHKRRAATSR